jgi:hypothetical protein
MILSFYTIYYGLTCAAVQAIATHVLMNFTGDQSEG